MELREVVYKHSRSARAKVAYTIAGDKIYFSGLTSFYQGASTINVPEDVVCAIEEAEGIDRRDYRFFDIQTHRGYGVNDGDWSSWGYRGCGYFSVDELLFDANGQSRTVAAWHNIAKSESPEWGERPQEVSSIPGVPDEVFQLFRELIYK